MKLIDVAREQRAVGAELWKPISGYETAYEVSSFGRVRSLRRHTGSSATPGKMLKLRAVKKRLHATLVVKQVARSFAVGRLVLSAFVGPCPDGMECCHNDGNFRNNALANLRWDTQRANIRDRDVVHGTTARGSRMAAAKLSEADVLVVAALRASGQTLQRIADQFGVSKTLIARIIRRETWRHVQIDCSSECSIKKQTQRRAALVRQRTQMGTFA